LVIAPTLASMFADSIQKNREEKMVAMQLASKKAGMSDEAYRAEKAGMNEAQIVETQVTNIDGNIDSSTISGTLKDGEFVADLGDISDLTLADGSILKVGANSIENKLVNFILNGTIDTENKSKNWLSFDRLQFETGSSKLKPSSEDQLKNLVAILKAYPSVELKLGGYTDNTGEANANLKLSAERANSVMSSLVKQGIASTRLQADGYGQEFPVGDNNTEIGRAMNRRIDVKVSKK